MKKVGLSVNGKRPGVPVELTYTDHANKGVGNDL